MSGETVRIDGDEIDWIRVTENDGEYDLNIQVPGQEMSIPVDSEFYEAVRSLVDDYGPGVGRIERE